MIEDEEIRILFQAESEERLKSLKEQLIKLERDNTSGPSIETAFRDIHTIKGSARMLDIKPIELLAHQLETFLDVARKKELQLTKQHIQLLFKATEYIQSFVNEAITGEKSNLNIKNILNELNEKEKQTNTDQSSKPITPHPFPENASEPSLKQTSTPLTSIRVSIPQISALMNQAADLAVAKNRMVRLFEKMDELYQSWEKIYESSQYDSFFHRRIKKQNEGEGLSQAGILNAFKEIGENLGSLRNESYDDINNIEIITTHFTESIQLLNLIPLSKLFDYFPGSIQEMALTLGKEIDLEISGGDIAVDKKIIEEMKDPLMHLLRNSLSHGIENPENREKKGKPRRGNIHITAKQTLNNILIEVSDDGQGLDVDKIKHIALEKKLIKTSEIENRSLAQINELIFLPGFSTATEISNVSGRGVGLDVVKEQVGLLKGNLTVNSIPNQGCSFFIELPFFHITTEVILVKSRQKFYAFPINIIETCIDVSLKEKKLENNEVFILNQIPIPLYKLSNFVPNDLIEVIGAERKDDSKNDEYCIVFSNNGQKIAILVDQLVEEQKIVVVPPNPFFHEIKCVLGSCILKTGEACIILDPFKLSDLYE